VPVPDEMNMHEEMNAALRALDEQLTLKERSGRVVLTRALLATVYYEDPYKREGAVLIVT
jgi:hypothetical protein